MDLWIQSWKEEFNEKLIHYNLIKIMHMPYYIEASLFYYVI